jgi:hypothetical protein
MPMGEESMLLAIAEALGDFATRLKSIAEAHKRPPQVAQTPPTPRPPTPPTPPRPPIPTPQPVPQPTARPMPRTLPTRT